MMNVSRLGSDDVQSMQAALYDNLGALVEVLHFDISLSGDR